MNTVNLTGRLARELELRKTSNGISQCNFVIAVNDGYGEHKKAYFINCVAWRASADFLYQYARKGDLIGVSGKLASRSYEKEGCKVYVIEVICESVEILANKKQESSQNENASTQNESPNVSEEFTETSYPWE